jgi:hypothetical protein
MLPILALAFAAAVQTTASAGTRWIERYFGVGSAQQQGLACEAARGHAGGNFVKACVERRGMRTAAAYTDCICSQLLEGEHVCNVNLKVGCEARASGGTPSRAETPHGGKPKGRADRGATGRGPLRDGRPGPAAPHSAEDGWTGALP